jgi:thioredoxin reductase (NADPH)
VTQAERFGVEIVAPQEAERLTVDGPYKRIQLADGSEIACHVLMLAMGVSWRKLPADGADRLAGRGIYYGAAMTEAMSCKDETVYIVGAGNSAGQAAMYFAEYARRVVMVIRGDDLGKSMSHYLVERIEAHERIDVRLNTEVVAACGGEHLESLVLRDGATEDEVETRYLFVFIGAAPRTEWLDGVVVRDERGFVRTGPDLEIGHLDGWPLERAPYLLEASVPGVFVAGDVRHESVKRVASAVGEGSVAVHFMHQHLATL